MIQINNFSEGGDGMLNSHVSWHYIDRTVHVLLYQHMNRKKDRKTVHIIIIETLYIIIQSLYISTVQRHQCYLLFYITLITIYTWPLLSNNGLQHIGLHPNPIGSRVEYSFEKYRLLNCDSVYWEVCFWWRDMFCLHATAWLHHLLVSLVLSLGLCSV